MDREVDRKLRVQVQGQKLRSARCSLQRHAATSGYFAAVEGSFFVDTGIYPETNGDIVRRAGGGIAAGTIVEKAEDYLAVCHRRQSSLTVS